jgi:futalosine hydrolase
VILVVAATARELEFVEGAETLVCGIGPVEAAAATASGLAAGRPHALLHIGIAGAQTLEPPALVLGSEAVYADACDPQSTFPRIDRVEPDQALLVLARSVLPEAHVLPIATSARVGGGGVCEVEAMEGFGVLRAAALAGVPALELRAVSNSVGEANRKLWRIDDALAMLAATTPRLIAAFDA